MTTIAQDFRTFVIGTTTISGIIGSSNAARMHYNNLAGASDYEHIWYRTTSDTVERTMDAVGLLHYAMMDLEIASTSEAKSQALADAVFNRLDGYRGAMGNSSVQACFLSDKDDSYERQTQQDEGVHTVAYGVRLWYTT